MMAFRPLFLMILVFIVKTLLLLSRRRKTPVILMPLWLNIRVLANSLIFTISILCLATSLIYLLIFNLLSILLFPPNVPLILSLPLFASVSIILLLISTSSVSMTKTFLSSALSVFFPPKPRRASKRAP